VFVKDEPVKFPEVTAKSYYFSRVESMAQCFRGFFTAERNRPRSAKEIID
jgi:hypothetical protein